MSINLHIQAVDGEDLRRQLTSILGLREAEYKYDVEVEVPVGSAGPSAEGAPEPNTEAPKATRRRTSKTEQTVRGTTVSAETTSSASADAAEAGEQAGSGAKTADESEASAQPATSSSTSAADTASSDGSSVTINTIRELTLSVVDKRGKDGIEAVLSQFGVARSTQVPEEQWGELAQALRDALED